MTYSLLLYVESDRFHSQRFCAPRGRIILLKDYGDKATYSKNFLISAVFYVSYSTTTVNIW